MRNMIILNHFIGLLMLAIIAKAQKKVTSVAGRSVTLPCDLPRATPPRIKWVDYIHNQFKDPQIIFDSDNNQDRNIDSSHPIAARMKIEDDFSLTISDLQFNLIGDAGDYICISVQDNGEEKQLPYRLSIAGVVNCSGDNDLVEGDRSVLNCVTPFAGEVPTLTWYLSGEKVESEDGTSLEEAKKVYTIESASGMYDAKTLTCKMEIGDIRDECSISITVQYLVNKVDISPDTEEIRVTDEVTCKANGNPQSKVELTFTGKDVSEKVEGMQFVTFTIPKEWEGNEVSALCQASNTLDGKDEQKEKTHTYKILVVDTTTSTTTAKVETKAMEASTEPAPTPEFTEKIAPPTPKPGAGTDEEKPGTKTGGGNIVGIVAGVIIAALVIVVIVIAVACILRKSSKKHKGAKPVPTKEEDMKRMEDGKA